MLLIRRILRFVLRIAFGVMAAIFAISLLAAALIVVLISVLKSLVTGRKPAPSVVFGNFQRFSPQGMWPGATSRPDARNDADVVDVEVREVREPGQQKHLP